MVLRNVKTKEDYIQFNDQNLMQGIPMLIRCMTDEKTIGKEKEMVVILPNISSTNGRWNFQVFIVDIGKNCEKCNIIVRAGDGDKILGTDEVVIKTNGQGIAIMITDVRDWRGWQLM